MSTAVTDLAEARAAAMASAPDPVHTSTTSPVTWVRRRRWAASSHVSLLGSKTPGNRTIRIDGQLPDHAAPNARSSRIAGRVRRGGAADARHRGGGDARRPGLAGA